MRHPLHLLFVVGLAFALLAGGSPLIAAAQDDEPTQPTDPADPAVADPDPGLSPIPDKPDEEPGDPGTTDPQPQPDQPDPQPQPDELPPGFDDRPAEMNQPPGNGDGNTDTPPGDGDGETPAGEEKEKKDPEFKISGLAYFGWAIDFNSPSGVANQFFVSKVWIGIDAILDEQFSARFAIEMSDPTNTLQTGFLNGLFVKDLYVQVKHLIFDDSVLRIGMHPAMWLELEESWWDFRFVARTLVEAQNIQQPNDFGISYKTWIRDSVDSENQFWVKVGIFNGGGAVGAQQAAYDDLSGTISDVWKTPGVEFAWFNKSANMMLAVGWVLNAGPSSVFDDQGMRIFFGFRIGDVKEQGYVAAISGYAAIERNTGFQEGDALGLSIWGALAGSLFDEELKDFGALLRFDLFDPNTNDTTTDLQFTLFVGVYWYVADFMRLYTGYRRTHNLDLSQSVEDVLGVWADFHF